MATFRQPTLPSPQELRDKTYHRGYAADDGTRVMYQRDWAKQHLLEGDGLLPLFYDHLSKIDRSHEQRLRGVCLPDTVVYEHNFPRAWYGWDRETQEIVKRPGRDLDARTIYAEFCERKDRKCDIIAQYCYVRGAEAAEEEVAGGATRRRGAHFLQTQRQHHDDDDEDEQNTADNNEIMNSARGQRTSGGLHRRNSQQKKLHEELERERRRREKEMQQIYRPDTCVEFFTSETLYAFLTNPKPKPDGVLQRFVLPKGKSSSRHNFQLQAIWSPVVTLVYKRTNRYLLGDTTIGVAQRAPTFDGPPHLSTESLVAGSTLNRIDIVCRAIADHITFTEKKPIERLIAYFKEDDEDRLWLMWASSLRVGGDQLNPVHVRVPMNLALRVETIRTILPKAEASKANTIENDEDALLSKDVQLFDMTGDRDFARKCGGDLFPVNSNGDHHHHSKKQKQSNDDDYEDDRESTSNTTTTKSPPHSARASAASGMTSSLQLPVEGGSSASMTSNNVLLTPHPPKNNNNPNNTDDETSNATNNLNNNTNNPMNESMTSGLSNTIGSMGSGATATNVTNNNNTSFSGGAVPSSPRNTKNRFNPNNYAKGVLPPSILLEKLEREQQQQMQQQQQGNDYGSNSPDSPTLSNNNNNNNNTQRENSTARRRNSPPLSGRSTTNTNRPGTSARSTGASTTNASYYSSSGSKSGGNTFPHKIFISPRAPFLALSHATHVPTIKEDSHPFHRAVTNSEKEHHRAEREKKLNREVGRSARKPPAAIVLLPGYKEAYAQQNRRRLSFKTANRSIEDAEKLKSELLRFSQDMMYEAHSSSLASAKSIDRDFQVPVPPLLTQCLDENELESLCRVMRVKSAQLVPIVNSDGTSGVRVVVTVPGGVSGRGSRKDRPLVQLNDDVKMFYEFLFQQNGQVLWDRYCGAAM